ncbi:hypothetical protein HCZ23_13430 [Celeribacter sp. HF31]|nr:hypothetical protein [Celeribacter sp. HF31]
MTIRHNAVAARFLSENGARATRVESLDRTTWQSRQVHADHIVLSASPIETVCLLWTSKSDQHPDGVGNNADPFTRVMFRKFFHESMSIGAAIRESGGEIVGADPSSSVLNAWEQVWEMSNVVVADASAFPRSGVAGTTLTVMAHAKRVCRHLARGSNSAKA